MENQPRDRRRGSLDGVLKVTSCKSFGGPSELKIVLLELEYNYIITWLNGSVFKGFVDFCCEFTPSRNTDLKWNIPVWDLV